MRAGLRVGLVLAFSVFGACTPRPADPCAEDYAPCAPGGVPCAEGSSCESLRWEFGSGTMCARACESELDCPSVDGRLARCLSISGSPHRCYDECSFDSECPGGWVCQPYRSGTSSGAICLP